MIFSSYQFEIVSLSMVPETLLFMAFFYVACSLIISLSDCKEKLIRTVQACMFNIMMKIKTYFLSRCFKDLQVVIHSMSCFLQLRDSVCKEVQSIIKNKPEEAPSSIGFGSQLQILSKSNHIDMIYGSRWQVIIHIPYIFHAQHPKDFAVCNHIITL